MNLMELKIAVDDAVQDALDSGELPTDVMVSIQVSTHEISVCSDNVELHYDGDGCASGCVLVGDSR